MHDHEMVRTYCVTCVYVMERRLYKKLVLLCTVQLIWNKVCALGLVNIETLTTKLCKK